MIYHTAILVKNFTHWNLNWYRLHNIRTKQKLKETCELFIARVFVYQTNNTL